MCDRFVYICNLSQSQSLFNILVISRLLGRTNCRLSWKIMKSFFCKELIYIVPDGKTSIANLSKMQASVWSGQCAENLKCILKNKTAVLSLGG